MFLTNAVVKGRTIYDGIKSDRMNGNITFLIPVRLVGCHFSECFEIFGFVGKCRPQIIEVRFVLKLLIDTVQILTDKFSR